MRKRQSRLQIDVETAFGHVARRDRRKVDDKFAQLLDSPLAFWTH